MMKVIVWDENGEIVLFTHIGHEGDHLTLNTLAKDCNLMYFCDLTESLGMLGPDLLF